MVVRPNFVVPTLEHLDHVLERLGVRHDELVQRLLERAEQSLHVWVLPRMPRLREFLPDAERLHPFDEDARSEDGLVVGAQHARCAELIDGGEHDLEHGGRRAVIR